MVERNVTAILSFRFISAQAVDKSAGYAVRLKERVNEWQHRRTLSEEYEYAQQDQYDEDRRQPPPFGLFQKQE